MSWCPETARKVIAALVHRPSGTRLDFALADLKT